MRLIEPFLAAAFAAGFVVAGEAAARADQASYFVNQWPQDIGKVPCEAWHRTSNGGWMQVAFIQASSTIVSGKIFAPGTGEAQMLNAKCAH